MQKLAPLKTPYYKLTSDSRPNNRKRDIICGRHSGIPECCIKFFIDCWAIKYMRNKKLRGRYWALIHIAEIIFDVEHWGYIPCPDCLITGKRRAALARCNCHI